MDGDTQYDWHQVPSITRAQLTRAGSAGRLIACKLARKDLCLVSWQGNYFAIDNTCPHQKGKLAGGWIDEAGQVICPWHRFAFSLQDGRCDSGGYFVNTYPVRVEDKRMWVGLPKRKSWFW